MNKCFVLCLALLSYISLWAEPQGNIMGIVKPLYDIELSLPVDGALVDLQVKEGDQVKKNDLLIRLDDKLQSLDVKRKKMAWVDRSQLETHLKNLAVMRKLVENKRELNKSTQTISEADLQRFEMQLTKSEGEAEGLEELERREELEYEISSEMLRHYQLRSPINGNVIKIEPAVGEWVKMGEPVLRLVDTSRCFVELDVEVAISQLLRKNPDVILNIPNGEQQLHIKGEAKFISVVADSSSSLVRVKVYFDNTDGVVVPGVTAYLEL